MLFIFSLNFLLEPDTFRYPDEFCMIAVPVDPPVAEPCEFKLSANNDPFPKIAIFGFADPVPGVFVDPSPPK
jgi:hypothetical protein